MGLWDRYEDLQNIFWGTVGELVGSAADQVDDVVNGIASVGEWVYGHLTSQGEYLYDQVKGAEELAIDRIESYINTIKGIVDEAGEGVGSVINQGIEALDDVVEIGKGIIQEGTEQAIDIVTGLVSEGIEVIENKGKEVLEDIEGVIGDAERFAKQALEEAQEAIDDYVLPSFEAFFGSAFGALTDFVEFQGFAEDVLSFVFNWIGDRINIDDAFVEELIMRYRDGAGRATEILTREV